MSSDNCALHARVDELNEDLNRARGRLDTYKEVSVSMEQQNAEVHDLALDRGQLRSEAARLVDSASRAPLLDLATRLGKSSQGGTAAPSAR